MRINDHELCNAIEHSGRDDRSCPKPCNLESDADFSGFAQTLVLDTEVRALELCKLWREV